MSTSRTVLVTGGTGYVATFCIARLLSDGHHVRTTVRDLRRAGKGRYNPVIRHHLFELDAFRPVSSEKARRELAWEPRPNDEAIVATAESLISQKLLSA